jgi:2-polyprenyl-3-methyl-5-hydroxy-6-metoxy-1,4-benzoquinol methylase
MENANSEIKNCLICNYDTFKPLLGYEKDHLVKCKKCSFVFSNLRPTESELYQVYSAYQRGANPPTIATLDKLRSRAKRLLENINAKVVLDVGCGDGDFLAVFSEMGIETYGTEFDSESSTMSASKGAVMLNGGLIPILPNEISGVDVIIFTEVIEHINNPQPVLRNFYEIMNAGALLYITTPNFSSLERILLGPKWGMIAYPEHISYYSPKTLDNILSQNGFKKIENYTENVSLYRIFQFINRVNNSAEFDPEKISAQAQALTSGNKVFGMIKSVINAGLRLTNMGSSIVAVYQKK